MTSSESAWQPYQLPSHVTLSPTAKDYLSSMYSALFKRAALKQAAIIVMHIDSMVFREKKGEVISRKDDFFDIGFDDIKKFPQEIVSYEFGFPAVFSTNKYYGEPSRPVFIDYVEGKLTCELRRDI
jgi:hypothetical protein